MTNPDSSNRAAADCEAIQQLLSEKADTGAALTPELQMHVDSCAACADFAEQWLPGPPAALARRLPGVPDPALRERILDAAAHPNIVDFPVPAVRRTPWATVLGRIAACLVLAGFSYWLLNPAASPVRPRPASPSAPMLTQGLLQMEGKTKHEQDVLRSAVAAGGSRVSSNVAWTVSALEL